MDYKAISYEVLDNRVAVVTLNRPASLNAINLDLATEVAGVLRQAEQDDSVRVLVVTGAGKAFCAGGDLAWLMAADDNLKKREILENAATVITLLDRFSKPVIAAVNGAVAGAGTAVALACDIIIASDRAKFAPNFVNIASVPDSGASWFLPRKIGYHKAAELMLTGRLLDAQECLQLGLFNRVVAHDELEQAAFRLAQKLAAGPQRAIRHIKQMLKMSAQNTLTAQLEIEASMQLMAWSDDDFNEGVSAFLQKRKPAFK
ncbi:enoyl-CoA hydratase/isomerase family protein [Desulfoscipio geothermicus]|uniref:2-(1,2-epoxy-1,2-dihydrophenyl)acetyl-CoA isomerase n=1 Tax=Desulfoscipio geothermicus DSM 3669 TaxID=1121426 RepID=A0A1I6CNJ0_9FIRM|nr:enoyl-CoA hydratase-related protein [Desulfoscipio geothermicus]SFQ94747.1 2-(1,2-epoxy-1,2-dihydrophenyl)acetyl-CoA isomerase [Desulfoscipio geothermicus DSM 3669]